MIGDTADVDIDNQNVASDNAHVDQQIGVQYIDSVHHNATIYSVSDHDGPERRHQVALAYLAGGVPRSAQHLFGDLVFKEEPTTERAYYYVLSVLSERGFGDLTAELVTGIHNAWKLCESLPEDDWKQAHRVVRELLDHVLSTEADESFTAVAAFGRLFAERQDEISRHLSMLVDGLVEQKLNATRKHQVSTERLSGERCHRASKFFEPDPLPPTRYRPRMLLREPKNYRSALIGAAVAALAFVGLFVGPMTFSFWGGLLLLVVGCAVMARFGVEHTAHLLNLALRRDTTEPSDEPAEPTFVDKLVERCFRDARPEYAKDWSRYADGYRTRLKQRFNAEFRYDDDQDVKRAKWLFDWHARRVAARWPHHDPHGRLETIGPRGVRLWQAAGTLIALVGLIVLLFAAQRWSALPIAVGGFYALPALVEFVAARRATVLPLKEANELFDEEEAEYYRWSQELKDRPTDSEMARWLALDKAYLRAQASSAGNIAERDLVSHVVINQFAPGARGGLVLHGPPRYTAYLVTVILLTRHGVRASRVYLDFTTGEVKNENWDVFGYDRIASASLRVLEKSVRKRPGAPLRKVRDREFKLRLLDGAEIIRVKERLDGGNDAEVDDEAELERLAAATSGMDAALPILEAVAHQGPAWIEFERARRSVWSHAWSG